MAGTCGGVMGTWECMGARLAKKPRESHVTGPSRAGAGAELSRAVPGEPGRAELCQAEPGRAEPGGDVLGGSPGGANVPHVVSLVLVRFVCRCKIESAIYREETPCEGFSWVFHFSGWPRKSAGKTLLPLLGKPKQNVRKT